MEGSTWELVAGYLRPCDVVSLFISSKQIYNNVKRDHFLLAFTISKQINKCGGWRTSRRRVIMHAAANGYLEAVKYILEAHDYTSMTDLGNSPKYGRKKKFQNFMLRNATRPPTPSVLIYLIETKKFRFEYQLADDVDYLFPEVYDYISPTLRKSQIAYFKITRSIEEFRKFSWKLRTLNLNRVRMMYSLIIQKREIDKLIEIQRLRKELVYVPTPSYVLKLAVLSKCPKIMRLITTNHTTHLEMACLLGDIGAFIIALTLGGKNKLNMKCLINAVTYNHLHIVLLLNYLGINYDSSECTIHQLHELREGIENKNMSAIQFHKPTICDRKSVEPLLAAPELKNKCSRIENYLVNNMHFPGFLFQEK